MFDLEIIDDTGNSQKIDFCSAFERQKILLSEILDGARNETIWFLEHESVFTAGKSALDSDFLGHTGISKDIPIIKTNRGGKFTYHGPGQLIVYIFLNLKNVFYPFAPDLQKFIQMIEIWILNSLRMLGVRNLSLKPEVNHGIWIDKKKISAIGINVQKWVSSHGICVNIDPDMKFFEKIIPCGISNYGVTSLKEEGYDQITKDEIIDSMIKNFFEIFDNYKMKAN
jgi:lipoyl(octanoyl) transferase